MNLNETKDMRVIFILEVAGKPPEHLTKTLENIIEKIKKEKGVKLIDKKTHEPSPIKDQENFYTNFTEIELEIENPSILLSIIFRYMPSHVEIVYPESIKFTNDGLGIVLNELTRRLHGYDEIARIIQVEKKILEKKLKSILGEKKEPEKKDKK
jgi:hypothetical protein